MLTILLAGPGGKWIGVLKTLVLLAAILKAGSVLYTKFTAWYAKRKDRNKDIVRRKIN